MNTKSYNYRYVLAAILLLAGVVLANGDDKPSSWVKGNIAHSEKLLCHRQIGDDQFFNAAAGDKIKSGYLIDVTNAAGAPKTYVFSWKFTDENGKSLETNTPPKDIKDGYVKSGSKTFSENVGYRFLHTEAARKAFASVELKKYANKSDAPSSPDQFEKEDGLEKISICEIPLGK